MIPAVLPDRVKNLLKIYLGRACILGARELAVANGGAGSGGWGAVLSIRAASVPAAALHRAWAEGKLLRSELCHLWLGRCCWEKRIAPQAHLRPLPQEAPPGHQQVRPAGSTASELPRVLGGA